MEDDTKMAKGLMLGFLTGGLLGATIALLYAPKSGRELRADIKHKTDEFIDDTSEYMQIAREKAETLINEGRRKSELLIQDAKKKASSLIDDANTLLSEAKGKASHKYDETKEKLSHESDRIKDAFRAGVDAYKDEKTKNVKG
jgi:gas vesicle protein